MDEKRMLELAADFLEAWNTQDVQKVLATYTSDVFYVDPNTRGAIEGAESLGRYLVKLFEAWQMHWSLREAHLFEDRAGCAVLWHARLKRMNGRTEIEVDGMDLVQLQGELISRNEVYFDRAALLPLLQEQA